MNNQYVLVTTQHRGIFFGKLVAERDNGVRAFRDEHFPTATAIDVDAALLVADDSESQYIERAIGRSGYGDGSGYGSGYGSGDGSGDGSGSGYGDGSGDGDG